MDRILTATAVIIRGETVLLVEHLKSGYLLPPGGCLEHGEDPVQAVRREIREEVGLELDLIDQPRFAHPAITALPLPWTVQVVDIPAGNGQPQRQHVDFVYRAYPRTTVITPQASEIGGYQWAPIEALPEHRMPTGLPELLRHALLDPPARHQPIDKRPSPAGDGVASR